MLYTKSIKYPNTFDLVSGKTQLDDKLTSINRCIALVLTSAKGELLGEPNFGSRLYELLFEQYSDSLQKIIKSEIVECVGAYESRVTFSEDNITIEPNDVRNSFTITINYTVKNSSSKSQVTVELEEDMYGKQ